MPLSSTDKQHPEAWNEALWLAGLKPGAPCCALAEFSAVFDSLYDGTQFPATPYIGASGSVQGSFDEQHKAGSLIVFYRVFWERDTCGLVAALCEADFSRPVLMAMTAFGLPGGQGETNETAAVTSAIQKAIARSVDL